MNVGNISLVISLLRLFFSLLQQSHAQIPWRIQSVGAHVPIPARTLREERCVTNTALMDASVLQVMCIDTFETYP